MGPDAVFTHRYFSFGAPFAIRGFSPMRYDGSGSRGDGLSYFIEFGDGQVSIAPVAVHPIEGAGQYSARLTVVDRFGRADAEVLTVWVHTLQNYVGRDASGAVFYETRWETRDGGARCKVFLDLQRGADLGGTIDCGELQGRVSGLLGGQDEVRLLVEPSGIRLEGILRYAGSPHYLYNYWWSPLELDLSQTGGAQTGLVRKFRYICDSACTA